MPEKIVIGMTGPFGSDCSYITKEILEKCGYEYISLSDILRSVIGSNDDPVEIANRFHTRYMKYTLM